MAKFQAIRPIHILKTSKSAYNYLSSPEILLNGGGLTTASKVGALFHHQKSHFKMLNDGLQRLSELEYRTVELPCGLSVLIELNERRIRNTANHQEEINKGRSCFLCSVNQDPNEKAIYYDDEVSILTNPNPCLPLHIVISYNKHVDQSFFSLSNDAFAIAKELKKHQFVFFNGANMGATAPDHAHLQAAARDNLPLEKYLLANNTTSSITTIFKNEECIVTMPIKVPFSSIVIEAKSSQIAQMFTATILAKIDSLSASNCNIAITYQDNFYRTYIFPRSNFRPPYFSADPYDTLSVGISPAALEMLGIIITPFKKDFDTVDDGILQKIFKNVSPNPNKLMPTIESLFN